jgi:hypothetical protein
MRMVQPTTKSSIEGRATVSVAQAGPIGLAAYVAPGKEREGKLIALTALPTMYAK